jgi:hypothetical protein
MVYTSFGIEFTVKTKGCADNNGTVIGLGWKMKQFTIATFITVLTLLSACTPLPIRQYSQAVDAICTEKGETSPECIHYRAKFAALDLDRRKAIAANLSTIHFEPAPQASTTSAFEASLLQGVERPKRMHGRSYSIGDQTYYDFQY